METERRKEIDKAAYETHEKLIDLGMTRREEMEFFWERLTSYTEKYKEKLDKELQEWFKEVIEE